MPRRVLAALLHRLDRSPLPLTEKGDLEAELLALIIDADRRERPRVNVAFVGEA